MRTNANIATVRAYEVRPEGLADTAKVLKNIVLFAAAPFIGLAYAAAFPFVAIGMLAWYGVRALRKKAGAA